MKTLTMTLLLASLVSPLAGYAGENIGNNEVELAVNATLNANDGLSLEEKIYKLWQEAEGSLPQMPSRGYECYSGLAILDAKKIIASQACLGFEMPVVAGPIEVFPKFEYGLFEGYRYQNYAGPLSPVNSRFTSLGNDMGSDRSARIQNSVITRDGSRILKNAGGRTEIHLRALSDNILVGVTLPTTYVAPGYCDNWDPIHEELAPSVKVNKKSKKATVSEPKIIGWKQPNIKVAGVCGVFLYTVKHEF